METGTLKTYAEKLRDPRWQKRRLELLEKTKFTCVNCGDGENELHIHHLLYERGKEPWEYEDKLLLPLCGECHTSIDRLQKNITRLLAGFPPDFLSDLQEALQNLSAGSSDDHPWERWSKWMDAAKPKSKRRKKSV
jgi:hypothetical protein